MDSIIGVAGDWHGNQGWSRLRLQDFAELGVTKIIQLGDFGFWPNNSGQKFLHKVNKNLRLFGQTLYVTLGNHEDYAQISRLQPVPDGSGWLHNPQYPHILVASRGLRWEWGGTSFVSLGGANSIDKIWRTPGHTWWKEEQISLQDVFETVSGGHADVMVSHDCPAGVPLFGGHKAGTGGWSYEALEYANKSREKLRSAVDGVKPDLLMHGHYHFLAEYNTVLNDGLADYSLRSVGFASDKMQNNIALLSLPDLELSFLKYYISEKELR